MKLKLGIASLLVVGALAAAPSVFATDSNHGATPQGSMEGMHGGMTGMMGMMEQMTKMMDGCSAMMQGSSRPNEQWQRPQRDQGDKK